MGRVDIDVICRNRQTIADFTLDSERSLLGLRIAVIRLPEEQYGARRKWAAVADLQADWRSCQVCLRDTGVLPPWWCAAQNLALRKHDLVDRGGVLERICTSGYAQNRDQSIGNLPGVVDIPKGSYDVGNLRING